MEPYGSILILTGKNNKVSYLGGGSTIALKERTKTEIEESFKIIVNNLVTDGLESIKNKDKEDNLN